LIKIIVVKIIIIIIACTRLWLVLFADPSLDDPLLVHVLAVGRLVLHLLLQPSHQLNCGKRGGGDRGGGH
jgi:hypothetical protein